MGKDKKYIQFNLVIQLLINTRNENWINKLYHIIEIQIYIKRILLCVYACVHISKASKSILIRFEEINTDNQN